MLLSAIIKLLTSFVGLSPIENYPQDVAPNLRNGDAFDFIVVGGGSAGSVIASRLSEIPQWNVLLIEAGGYPSAISEVPALAFFLQGTEEDWQYETVPSQTSCLGLKNHALRFPRGKGLGGSSLINLMFYTRSNRYDHEQWVRNGNVGWDYDSVIEYYTKLENAQPPYGTAGNFHLMRHESTQPLRNILTQAYQELGYKHHSEENPIGFVDFLMGVHQGTRQNAAKAFLAPVKSRTNLHVALNSHVSRILIDPTSLTAYGVEVKTGNQVLHLTAKNEVVLSAGTVSSPQVLMNSGIGPKDHLDEIGINVLRDLKVGDNLQDHAGYPFFYVAVDPEAVNAFSTFQMANQAYQFLMHRRGYLTNLDFINFGSYVDTEGGTSRPNVQIFHALVQQNQDHLVERIVRTTGVSDEVLRQLLEHNRNSHVFMLYPVLLHPRSSGRVRLRNADPFGKPTITTNHLHDENDVQVLLDAIKLVHKVVESEAMSAYHPRILELNLPTCKVLPRHSDAFWKCAIRHLAIATHHPTGTCKMGPANDTSAVVDAQLRVHGVERLRVIDASVIPTSPSGNTQAPTMMVAEKGADMIKKAWMARHDEL